MADERYEAGWVDVRGESWPVFVDRIGRWVAFVDSVEVYADSKDKMRDLLMRKTKTAAVELNLPFVYFEESWGSLRFKRGVIKGLHGGNGNVIAKYVNSKRSEQIDKWQARQAGSYLRDCTDEELAELSGLHHAFKEAEKAYRERKESLGFGHGGLVETVKRAIAAQTASAEGEE